VGVGPEGTPDLYEKFKSNNLILIDPLDEAETLFLKIIWPIKGQFFLKLL
jgi:hypothetical protein